MTLLFNNCTILPMTAPSGSTETFMGAVGVEGNRIVMLTDKVSVADDFRKAHTDVREIDCTGKLLMPGLINTHCHASMTLQRSYADDISLMKWLHEYIWPFESRQTPADIALGAELGIVEMLLGGVTSFVDMYWHEDSIVEPVKRLGIRAVLGCSYLDSSMDEFDRSIKAAMANAEGCDRIAIAAAPHSGYTCSAENLKYGMDLCRKYGLYYITHIAETEDEVHIIREKHDKTPVEYLDSLGLLTDRTIGAHCVHVTDSDIEILKRRNVIVSHNPQSNMKISSGIAPIEKMRLDGVRCTIGTDGTCSNNDLDMFEEIRSASFLQKSATKNPCAVPAYEILKMATVNAAYAMGHGGELGVIKEGALADIILVDLQKPHLQPIHDLVSNLIYCGKAADVDTVVVDGRILVEGGKLIGADLPKLFANVTTTVARLKG